MDEMRNVPLGDCRFVEGPLALDSSGFMFSNLARYSLLRIFFLHSVQIDLRFSNWRTNAYPKIRCSSTRAIRVYPAHIHTHAYIHRRTLRTLYDAPILPDDRLFLGVADRAVFAGEDEAELDPLVITINKLVGVLRSCITVVGHRLLSKDMIGCIKVSYIASMRV